MVSTMRSQLLSREHSIIKVTKLSYDNLFCRPPSLSPTVAVMLCYTGLTSKSAGLIPMADIKNGVKNPLPSGYKPELDVTDELGDKLASRYLQLIGICRWAIELGRIDIYLEV